MKQSEYLSRPVGIFLAVMAAAMTLLAGWHLEIAYRYPVSDLPMVDHAVIEKQIREKNLSRKEAVYYRKTHAGADTTEIR